MEVSTKKLGDEVAGNAISVNSGSETNIMILTYPLKVI